MAAVEGERLGLAGHAWFETYSVLTRLPPGARRSPGDVLILLETTFLLPVSWTDRRRPACARTSLDWASRAGPCTTHSSLLLPCTMA